MPCREYIPRRHQRPRCTSQPGSEPRGCDAVSSARADVASARPCATSYATNHGWTLLPASTQIKTYYLAECLQGTCDGTIAFQSDSSGDAVSCATQNGYVVTDITGQIVDQSGNVDATALADWCNNHPTCNRWRSCSRIRPAPICRAALRFRRGLVWRRFAGSPI